MGFSIGFHIDCSFGCSLRTVVGNAMIPVGLLDKPIQRIILLAVSLEDSLVWNVIVTVCSLDRLYREYCLRKELCSMSISPLHYQSYGDAHTN